jgi:hypothetical protein
VTSCVVKLAVSLLNDAAMSGVSLLQFPSEVLACSCLHLAIEILISTPPSIEAATAVDYSQIYAPDSILQNSYNTPRDHNIYWWNAFGADDLIFNEAVSNIMSILL